VLLNVFNNPAAILCGSRRHPRALDEAIQTLPRICSRRDDQSWYRQSDLISSSATSVRDAVLIGIALAGWSCCCSPNFRMTLMPALAVRWCWRSRLCSLRAEPELQHHDLGGMVAAVGLIIDDALSCPSTSSRRLHGNVVPQFACRSHATRRAAGPGRRKTRVLDAKRMNLLNAERFSLSTIINHIPRRSWWACSGVFAALSHVDGNQPGDLIPGRLAGNSGACRAPSCGPKT